MDTNCKNDILILHGQEITRENILALIEAGKQFDILLPKRDIDIQEKYKENICNDKDGES